MEEQTEQNKHSQLHEVVGAVLRDIAQARFTSDFYSKEISKIYESDTLLRLFPVPRTEVKGAKVDMKFAIENVQEDLNRIQGANISVLGLFKKYSIQFVDRIFQLMRAATFDNHSNEPNSAFDEEYTTNLNQIDNSTFKGTMLSAFETRLSTLYNDIQIISKENNNTKFLEVRDLLFDEVVQKLIFDRPGIRSFIEFYPAFGGTSTVEALLITPMKNEFGDQLQNMVDQFKDVSQSVQDFKVDINVGQGQLATINSSALSSIKLKVAVRNYSWSQIEGEGDSAIRQLIPE